MIKLGEGLAIILMLLLPVCSSQNANRQSMLHDGGVISVEVKKPQEPATITPDDLFTISMLAEKVVELLGEPKRVEAVEQPWGPQEKWTYKKDRTILFWIEDGRVVGIEIK
jgi:hypothetical protein